MGDRMGELLRQRPKKCPQLVHDGVRALGGCEMAAVIKHRPAVQVGMALCHRLGDEQKLLREHAKSSRRLHDRDAIVGQLRRL